MIAGVRVISVDDHQRLDFLAAFGDEFCDALANSVGQVAPVAQDGFEVFMRAFQEEPSPQLLASLSDAQLERLRVESERYFETDGIAVEQIRRAIARTLARWPAHLEAFDMKEPNRSRFLST